MKYSTRWAMLAAMAPAAIAVACSSSTTNGNGGIGDDDDDASTSGPDGGKTGDAGGSGADGSANDGATGSDDGGGNGNDGGTGDDGGSSDDGGGFDAASLSCPAVDAGAASSAPECDPTKMLGTGAVVSSGALGSFAFAAITPDELTVSWIVNSGGVVPYVADRTSTGAGFSGATQITTDVIGGGGLTLTADGLDAVVVSSDGSAFVTYTRSSRSGGFSAAGDGVFATINAANGGDTYANPVLSGDGHVFMYSRKSASGASTSVYQSVRSDTSSTFPAGTALGDCELAVANGQYRTPFALSSDGRTLFYDDAPRGQARAAWRPSTSSPFTTFVTLSELVGVNAACSNGYYSAPDPTSGADDLYSATWQ